jgi:hypothetical protein
MIVRNAGIARNRPHLRICFSKERQGGGEIVRHPQMLVCDGRLTLLIPPTPRPFRIVSEPLAKCDCKRAHERPIVTSQNALHDLKRRFAVAEANRIVQYAVLCGIVNGTGGVGRDERRGMETQGGHREKRWRAQTETVETLKRSSKLVAAV